MNNKEIREKIESSDYDFLRTNEHLGNNIIYLTLGGSHAYGTDNEDSDLDLRGIAVENKNDIIGLGKFEQFDDIETDTVIYGLRKIMSLFLKCNPNTIEMLGTREDQIFVCNKHGVLLRNNKDIFLSQKAIGSFGGYANQQLRRLQNALCHDNYPHNEKERHILSSLQLAMTTFMDRYTTFIGDNSIKLYIDASEKEDWDTEIFTDIHLTHYPLRDFKNINNELSAIVKDYDKLNHRNRKKDDKHLYKHAMSLIRLYIMGIDILSKGKVETYRYEEKKLLTDLRTPGVYSFEEIFEMADKYEKEFEYACKNSILPEEPDYKKAEEIMITIYNNVIKNN